MSPPFPNRSRATVPVYHRRRMAHEINPLHHRYPAGWYILCASKSLGRRPRAVQAAGRHWAVFRSASGQVSAVEDRCLHRGMALSTGTVCGEQLRCPYHGWEYGGDGAVSLVPAMKNRQGLPADTLAALECCEADGYVFARIGETASSPHRFKHLGERGWSSFRMSTLFKASVDACVENFLDCPHATFVHRHWFRAPTDKLVRCTVTTLHDGAQAEFFGEPREKSLVWWLLSPRRGGMRHVDRFVSPHTTEVEYEFPNGLHYVITSVTRVHTVIGFRTVRGLGPLLRLLFEPLSRLIIQQDVRMLDAQQANLARHAARPFVSTPADVLGRHIQAWRRFALGDGPAVVAGTIEHVDLVL
jgi:phenylpropionate dioxygenase-like ring-hydroxylating dioxygenase large terminal subunit